MKRLSATIGVVATALAASLLAARQQVFRAGVDAVAVDVLVTERNRPVTGLTVRDFEIADNGVAQTVLDVTQETAPIDVTIVADMSAGGVVQTSVIAGGERIRDSLRPDDRVRVITFRSVVREESPLLAPGDIPSLRMSPGTHDWFMQSGHAACYDAIVLGAVTPPAAGRRQLMIVFSAGRDTASFLDAPTVADVVRRAGTAVFVVHAVVNFSPIERVPEGTTRLPIPVDAHAIPSRFFKELAEATGGSVQQVEPISVLRYDSQRVHFRARMNHDGLEAAFLRALNEFRASYVLRYVPRGVPREGWHELSVRVTKRGRYEVRARTGYHVGARNEE
jgi:hypothetical protein